MTKQNGLNSTRFDWTLIKELILKNLTFGGKILLSLNFIGFMVYKKWVFGENIGNSGVLLVIILLLYDSINTLYNWVIEESEKSNLA